MKKLENEYFIFDDPIILNWKTPAKLIIQEFKNIIYRVIYFFCKPKITEKKYNVAICAIFKNEGPYLKEWLEFNHLIGIEHFFMYNNNSEDNYLELLNPYISKGLVTLVQWPHNQKQMEAYKDCIEKYSSETKWLGFIDIDEFIIPKSTDNIYDFLKQFENFGAVNIYWKLFGSSGKIDRNLKSLVTQDFTVCWPKYCDIGKCFYNTAFLYNSNSKKNACLHHKFWVNINGKDVPPVNIFGKMSFVNRNIATNKDFPIQINHYFTKSFNEYVSKKAKEDVYFKENPHDVDYFYKHEMNCTDVDYSAYKYLIKLKNFMKDNND